MISYEQATEFLIGHFFTEIHELTPPIFTERVAKDYLCRFLSPEWVEFYWEKSGDYFITELLTEYNYRTSQGISVFFTFIDDYGRKIKGNINEGCDTKYSIFQQALMSLTHNEFERLSARILKFINCSLCQLTPHSHDQGLDAFGLKSLFSYKTTSNDKNSLDVWILIQAKHYSNEPIGTKEIREFYGASNFAIHKIYSTEKEKYHALNLKVCSPISLIVVTSSEVKRTVSILAKKSGIVLITSKELCSIFFENSDLLRNLSPITIESVTHALRQESSISV
jgi:hypothetical protein